MKIESEKALEKKLVKAIEAKGGKCFKFVPAYFTGLPDRICLMKPALCFFVEVKTTKKKPTKLQKSVHKMLQDLGFDVFIIDQSEQIETIIKDAYLPKC